MQSKWVFPEQYVPLLDMGRTEKAIKLIKDYFQTHLADALALARVTAPLLVEAGKGINDDLNGVEKPVSFPISALHGNSVEIVQSLAKWKRLTLAKLQIPQGRGIYTDMNAIRPDERLDNMHSLYVDQWDWERVIGPEERTLEFLKTIVADIYGAIKATELFIAENFTELPPQLPAEITFVHARELAAQYPDLTPRQRESRICQEKGAVFVIGIGAALQDGAPHDGRAPDYDDWISDTVLGPGLNGDLLCWYPLLHTAFEISSMGIRVTPESLRRQLALSGQDHRSAFYFHQKLLAGDLPLSIGGGIGQSRLCMFLLRKAHIGEVQAGIWPAEMTDSCTQHGIPLL